MKSSRVYGKTSFTKRDFPLRSVHLYPFYSTSKVTTCTVFTTLPDIFKRDFQLDLFYLWLHISKFVDYLPVALFLFSLFFCLTDSSSILCMEQDCKYVVNNDGNIQIHPKTGEPLRNCKITKSECVVALETIERIIDKISITVEKPINDIEKHHVS